MDSHMNFRLGNSVSRLKQQQAVRNPVVIFNFVDEQNLEVVGNVAYRVSHWDFIFLFLVYFFLNILTYYIVKNVDSGGRWECLLSNDESEHMSMPSVCLVQPPTMCADEGMYSYVHNAAAFGDVQHSFSEIILPENDIFSMSVALFLNLQSQSFFCRLDSYSKYFSFISLLQNCVLTIICFYHVMRL